jgi:hypothetical protein
LSLCDPTNPAYPLGDVDSDGVTNRVDNCISVANGPLAGPNNQLDTDGDRIGDVCDNCPLFANANANGTQAACPSPVLVADDDMDGILNYQDNCPRRSPTPRRPTATTTASATPATTAPTRPATSATACS